MANQLMVNPNVLLWGLSLNLVGLWSYVGNVRRCWHCRHPYVCLLSLVR